jgi:hypothetical protein
MNATEFEDSLRQLVTKAMPTAAPLMPGKNPDEDLAATMVAELSNHLGLVISFVSGGDPKVIDRLLEAVTERMYEAAAHHAQVQGKLAKMIRREQ